MVSAAGGFFNLHPEFEVLDWRGRPYFADFAYLPGPLKFIWEIKGFGPHVQDMDRKRYCNELNRELFLQSLGFRVVSFAYDDVAHRPELCVTLLRMLLGRYQAGAAPAGRPGLMEKEVIRLAVRLARPIRPIDVEKHFAVNHRTAVSWLAALCAKGWLQPMRKGDGEGRQHGKESVNEGCAWGGKDENCKGKGGGGKVLRYELDRKVWDYID